MERARLGSKVILKNTGNTEISHFGHLGCEKIKFEVDRSNFKKRQKWQFSIFFVGRYFTGHSLQ